MRPAHLCALLATTLSAACPAASALAGQTTGQAFRATQGCEKIEHFDPEWQAYNGDFGLNRPDAYKKHGPIWGFYQMRLVGDTLYATFGGDVENPRGTTPGALVALDAESMAFKRQIALPFAAHALAVDGAGKRAVATHTAANAFSLIDLDRRRVNCRKADTTFQGETYRGRYVVMDDQGSFFINYNNFADENEAGVIMKYTPDGEHAPDFDVQVTERAMTIPLAALDGRLLTGGKSVKSVDPRSGEITTLTAERSSSAVYNYARGPRGLLLASDYNAAARPQPDADRSGHRCTQRAADGSRLRRGRLRAAIRHGPGHQQYQRLDHRGRPAGRRHGLHARAVRQHPVRRRPGHDDHAAHRPGHRHLRVGQALEAHGEPAQIHAAAPGPDCPSVQGIEGISRPGACMITVFNLADHSVAEPQPCRILDAATGFQQTHARLEQEKQLLLPELDKERKTLASQQKELEDAQSQRGKNPTSSTGNHQTISRLTTAVASQQVTVQALERELAEDERGLQIFQRLGNPSQATAPSGR